MTQNQLGPIDLDAIYDEMNNEFIERMIRDLQRRTFQVAKELAHQRFKEHLNRLPHKCRKQLWIEAAEIVGDQVIQESGGQIY